MSMPTLVIPFAVFVGVTLTAAEQSSPAGRSTLVEEARKHGGITLSGLGCGGSRPTLEGLLKKADVVVHGTVVAVAAKLSEDQQEVWTDYTIQPTTVVLDRTPTMRLIRSSALPVFTARGGTVYVEGLKITHTVDVSGSRVRLDLGAEVVLLGTSRKHDFELEPFGLFHVQADTVSPTGKWPQLSADGSAVDLATFLGRVSAITSR